MKKKLLLLLFIPLFLHSSNKERDPFSSRSNNSNTYLLSYRRSGTHLLMYTMSFLTKQQCGDGRFNLATGVDLSKKKIFQIHNSTQALEWYGKHLNQEQDRLVLIVRDYKECMLREFLDDYITVVRHLNSPSEDIKSLQLFENLELFENWPNNNKLLIYYEDLLNNPKDECQRILNFLQAPNHYLESFIHNIDYHFAFPLNFYDQTHGGSFSKGRAVHYHTSLLPPGIEEEMDQIILNNHSFLTKKYLNRYLKNSAN